jgi:hypothetical protein
MEDSMRIFFLGMLCVLLGSTPLYAQKEGIHTMQKDERAGDPSLCGIPLPSESSLSSPAGDTESRALVESQCEIIDVGALMEKADAALAQLLEEWEKELWQQERLTRQVFRYTLVLTNDSPRPAKMILAGGGMLYSAYMQMIEDFRFDLPACSSMTLIFLSPWGPSGPLVEWVVGDHVPEWGWNIAGGSAVVLIPTWFQYHAERNETAPIPKDEAVSQGCK